MKKELTITLLMLLATPVFATSPSVDADANSKSISESTAVAVTNNENKNTQGQQQGQKQGQQQGQFQGQSADNAGNSQNVIFNSSTPASTNENINYSGNYKIQNVPGVSIGSPASGPCNGFSGGIGASIAGFGIGANVSKVDKGCTARETARIAAVIGQATNRKDLVDLAADIIYNTDVAQEVLQKRAKGNSAQIAIPVSEPATSASNWSE